MAEALGVVASILSICHAVSEGVNVTIELYNAPAEIKTLQVPDKPLGYAAGRLE
jgi:hypothetical protein